MPQNITSLDQLAPHARVGATFKFSRDKGATWTYVKLTRETVERFSTGARGYAANAEVTPSGSHGCRELTDRLFREGAIVRVASEEEVRGKKWSYES